MRSAAQILCCCFLLSAGPAPRLLGAESNAAPQQAAASADSLRVWTIDGAQHAGRVVSLAAGRLRFDGDSPGQIPLAEIERADCGPPPVTSVSWIGQDHHDLVRVGGAKEPNGIQDIHLRLRHLPKERTLQQVQIVVRYPTGARHRFRAWRKDTTRTTHWRIAVVRQSRVSPGVADLYLEPDSVDAFGKKFDLTLTFDNGSETKLSIQGATHTDDGLRVSESSPASKQGETDRLPMVQLQLAGKSKLRVGLQEVTGETISVATAWGDQFQVPIVQARGLLMIPGPAEEGASRFRDVLAQPGPQDQALLVTRENRIAPIQGTLESLGEGEAEWQYEGQTRRVKLDRLVGIVFARHPGRAPYQGPFQTFHFRNGDSLQARWKSIDGPQWKVELPWGTTVSIPAAELHAIDFHGGRMTYLSDLEPAALEEVPFFGRVMHMRRDRTFTGAPLKLAGTEYRKGLAVHSRCLVTYALDGQYAEFRANLGFDPSSEQRGDVECRVLVDGKPLFESGPFRSSDPAYSVEIPVSGGDQLTLEVDFGAREDIGDRVLWADAKLIRAPEGPP